MVGSVPVPKSMKAIQVKTEKFIRDDMVKYVGSETDAHFMMYLEKKYPTSKERSCLKAAADKLIEPSPDTITQVPGGEAPLFYTTVMQYCLGRNITPKALPRMADIWERLEQIFPCGLRTAERKLLSFFWQAPLQILEPNELQLRNGVARWAAGMMVTIAATESLEIVDINQIRDVLRTFGKLECGWDNERDLSKTMYSAIGTKLCASVAQRPDPDQLLENFEVIMNLKKPEDLKKGKLLTTQDYIHECCNTFNATQNARATKLDNHERRAVEWLSEQLPETRMEVKKIWAGPGKFTESGLSFFELSKEYFKIGHCMAEIADGSNGTWRLDLTTSLRGYYFFVMRAQKVFMANYAICRNSSRKNIVNLKTAASKLRDQDVEKAVLLCTWWASKEYELKEVLGGETGYPEMLCRFLRGSAS